MKILALSLVLCSVATIAHAEVKVDETLKNNFSYVNLAEPSQQDATALLMVKNNENGKKASAEKGVESDVSQCTVSNKQFVYCRR